jgi:hypothetical protein
MGASWVAIAAGQPSSCSRRMSRRIVRARWRASKWCGPRIPVWHAVAEA